MEEPNDFLRRILDNLYQKATVAPNNDDEHGAIDAFNQFLKDQEAQKAAKEQMLQEQIQKEDQFERELLAMRAYARHNAPENNNLEERRRAKLRQKNIESMERLLAQMRSRRIEEQRQFERRIGFSERQPDEPEVRVPIPPETPHPLGRLNFEFGEVSLPVLPPNKTSDFKLWSPIDFIQWVYQVIRPHVVESVMTQIAEFQFDGSVVSELATDAKMKEHLGLNDQQHSLLKSEARKVVNRYHLEKFEKEMEQYMNEWLIKEAKGKFGDDNDDD